MSIEQGGWPTKYELFPRLERVANFIRGVIHHDQEAYEGYFQAVKDPYTDCPDEVECNDVEAALESFVGREVALGHLTPEQALIRLKTPEHPAEEVNGYAEMSDQLRYGVEDGQQT